jgi:sirohydrochlorin cobaltochelatase
VYYNSAVKPEDFSDAALVLLGHGTTLNAESAAPVLQHANELRSRRVFGEVREAFWKQDPQVKAVLSSLANPRVFIVPLFISEGYFSEEVIPRELGFRGAGQEDYSRVQQHGGQTLFYCRAIGTHPSMTEVLLARARAIVEKFPFPRAPKPEQVTLFIAGHGTEQSENSRKVIEQQVALIRARGLYAETHGIFLDEEPRIGSCYQLARTRNVVVVPFFISDGLHVREDIPRLLGEPERLIRQRLDAGQPTWRNPTEKQGKLVWYTASVGTEPHIPDVIMERVREGGRGEG